MPPDQIDSWCSLNADNGVTFFPSWTFFTRRSIWCWAKTSLFSQWQERNSKPSLIMKTPNRKQVQPDYNLISEVYTSFLIIGKNHNSYTPYIFSANTESACEKKLEKNLHKCQRQTYSFRTIPLLIKNHSATLLNKKYPNASKTHPGVPVSQAWLLNDTQCL